MANKRALIVDDSTTAQYRLKKMLKAYALDIDVADSGEAALRYLATNVPDVVFMDHTMPGMDGLRALQVIKSHPETAIIPVIMYTSQSGDVYTGQARALGALDVVSKDKINATDLSKVMEAIHIYPIDKQVKAEATAAQKNNPKEKVTDIDSHRIERRSPNVAAAEHLRNVEYRLSHLEHIQEDNRRFIVARILRELQGLRQSMKQEMNAINQTPPIPAPAPVIQTQSTSIGFKILLTTLLLIIVFFLVQVLIQLKEQADNQIVLHNRIQEIAATNEPATTNKLLQTSNIENKNEYLTDLVWVFNQNAKLTFNQNKLDIKPLLGLHDLLTRIIASGFKGNALVTISVGNFCNTVNEMGEAQLAKPDTNINNCIFSNELYSIERIADEYSHEAHLIMNSLVHNHKGDLSIIINAQEGKSAYPERTPGLTAKEWNQIAEANNRVDLVLLPE